jgi:hypothetical protein
MIEPIEATDLEIGPTATQSPASGVILASDEVLMPDEVV